MTKRSDTWMPLYIGDYMADTMHLGRSEHGGYFLLIMAYWRGGKPLRDDDRYLAGITRSTAYEWKKLRPVMADFFHVENGFWRHKRIDAELRKSRNISEIRAEVGARGGRPKSNKNNDVEKPIAIPIASDLVKQTETPSPSPSQKEDRDESLSRPIARRSDAPDRFLEFYQIYPRHEGRGDAAKAWKAALKRASPDAIIAGAERYAAERAGQDKQYTKLPAAWLRADRWADGEEDEREREQRSEVSEEDRREALEQLRRLREDREKDGIFIPVSH